MMNKIHQWSIDNKLINVSKCCKISSKIINHQLDKYSDRDGIRGWHSDLGVDFGSKLNFNHIHRIVNGGQPLILNVTTCYYIYH